ncbi:hypothetical protein ACJX0J_016019, partial [Zea mays]
MTVGDLTKFNNNIRVMLLHFNNKPQHTNSTNNNDMITANLQPCCANKVLFLYFLCLYMIIDDGTVFELCNGVLRIPNKVHVMAITVVDWEIPDQNEMTTE